MYFPILAGGSDQHSIFNFLYSTVFDMNKTEITYTTSLYIYVTRSEKTDHVLHATKNEVMIVFIYMSFLLAHIKI